MKDEITINLRALEGDTRLKLEILLDTQLNGIPDDVNEEALEILRNFDEEKYDG